MSVFSETAKSALQDAAYDSGKAVFWLLIGWISQRFLLNRAMAMNVPGATAWAIVLALILAFAFLFGLDWWQVRRSLSVRRVRRLEYHGMHLLWMRSRVLDRHTTEAELNDVPRVVEKHRQELLDTTPELFPQSAVEGFRQPKILPVSSAAKASVKGLQNEETRAALVTFVDNLLMAVETQWEAQRGFRARKP